MNIWIYSLLSVFIVSLISFAGLAVLAIETERLKKILIYVISFSAGALLGDTFIHLLPEVSENGISLSIALYVLLGIIIFFILEKVIHWHHYHMPVGKGHPHAHPFAYTNLIGDGLHNFLDGVIIAGAYLIDVPVGIATTIAVIFHEIPQEIGDFGVLIYAGFSRTKALMMNFLSALTALIGVIAALLISNRIGDLQFILVPIAAGGFIYIAGSDLIPELHKERGIVTSLLQLAALLVGIGVMVLLLLLE